MTCKGAEAAFAAEALQRRKGTLELFVCSSVCFLNTNLTMSQTPQFSENRDKHPFFFFLFLNAQRASIVSVLR